MKKQDCFPLETPFPFNAPHVNAGGTGMRRNGQTRKLHENRIRYFRMKNVTLSADEELIEQARLVARSQRKTLNAAFREWLLQYTSQSGNGQEVDSLMKRLRRVNAGRHFTRSEMNERVGSFSTRMSSCTPSTEAPQRKLGEPRS